MTSATGAWSVFEERTCRFWNRMSGRPRWGWVFRAASRLGDGILWYVLMAVLAIGGGALGFATALRMAATGLVCTGLYKAIKETIRRPRPFVALDGIDAGLPPLDRFSFPSGHTMHACAFTVIACDAFPPLALALVPFTVLVALSRLVLGLHYASDVAVGAFLGTALATVSLGVPPSLAS